MSKIKSNLDKKMNGKALSFLKAFIPKLIQGKFQIVHFGWWKAGQEGKYGLSIYWNNLDELEE